MQIIARAHRQGLPITMNQLADELTIENLAAATASVESLRAERVVGALEMTPIQRWFFAEIDEPGHFHHVARVVVGREMTVDAVRGALVDGLVAARLAVALTQHDVAARHQTLGLLLPGRVI